MAKPRWLLKTTIMSVEGEKVAFHATPCRMPGSVLFRHRYHSETKEKKREVFL